MTEIARRTDIAPNDMQEIDAAVKRMRMRLNLDGYRNVQSHVDRFRATGDAEVWVWGER